MFSCTDAGTTQKYVGDDKNVIAPCVIDGDTINLYQYYYADASSIWIAKIKNKNNLSLSYQVGEYSESVIIIDESENKSYIKQIYGSIISENDSVIVIKRSKKDYK